MRRQGWAAVEAILAEAVARAEIPGAVAAAGRGSERWWDTAVGWAELGESPRAMHTDTLFDLASLTKVTATLPVVLRLAEEGRLALSDPVGRYLPAFAGADKAAVKIWHLLAHCGGLAAHRRLDRFPDPRAAAVNLPLAGEPGRKVVYSDLGFVVLGLVAEAAGEAPLDALAAARVFGPLGMERTRFNPPASWRPFIAATEVVNGRALTGRVHDENARALGGVAGHAGLFAPLADLVRYLAHWTAGAGTCLAPGTRARALACRTEGLGGCRGLGWVLHGDPHDPAGPTWPEGTAAHTGFTGTSLVFDPASGLWAVLLTNRLQLGRDHGIGPLRRRFHAAVRAAAGL